MAVRCSQHGRVPVPNRPKTDCVECWAGYGRWQYSQLHAVRQGTARGRGQSSKAKGRSAVVVVATMIREAFGLPEEDVWVKATSQAGVDIHLSAIARRKFPYAIEVKNVERFSVWDALKQATAAGELVGLHAVLFFKRARTPMYVAVSADEFMRLVKHAHQSEEPR